MERNVPKLRFNGFNDEWKEIKLGEFLTFYSTNSFSRDCLNYENGDVQNIHYGDIHMKFPTILDTEKYSIPYINSDINISKYSEESFCKDGDLVIADASEDYNDIGKSIEVCNIGNKKILSGLHTILARDNKQETAKGFKGYMMQSEFVRKQVKVLAAGAKVLGISKSNLEKVNVKLPTLQEQERIANFLTKVDKIIEKQEEKVKNLENYKKGMMQKIFSQEIRFKDENGEEYPEWEEKKIEDIFNITRGEVIAKTDISQKKDELNVYPVYSSQTSNYGILGYDSKYDFEGDYLSWTTDGANAGKVFRRKGKFRCTNVCGLLVEKKDTKGYANNCIKELLQKVTPKHVSYVGNPKLMNGVMGQIIIKVPCLGEQVQIEKLLSNVDLIIDKENNKLKDLKQWKKGLLQQMFV